MIIMIIRHNYENCITANCYLNIVYNLLCWTETNIIKKIPCIGEGILLQQFPL